MDQYSQQNLKQAATKSEHAVRKKEFDTELASLRSELQSHGHNDLAPKAGPTLTGIPKAPTAATGTNTTQLATTAFVQTAVGGKAASVHTHATGEIVGLDAALAAKANTSHSHTTAQVTGLDTALAAKAPLASPALTGTPIAPTATAGTNTTQLATTAFVTSAIAGKANTSHTHPLSQITDAATKANLVSPAFTGTPTAPTAASATNSTQIATTAFVKNQNYVSSVTDHGTAASGTYVSKSFYHVAAYCSGTVTGVLKIALPVAASKRNTMLDLEIGGYNYTAIAAWKLIFGGYDRSSNWTNIGAKTIGSVPFSEVRVAIDEAGRSYLLLGNETTVWTHPHIVLERVTAHYSGIASMTAAGWEISVVTDLSDLTLQACPLNVGGSYGDVALTGNPTATTQAAGNNSTRIATTAFVTTAIAGKANTSHTHTLSQITDASTKANLASPAFTGTPTAPTATAGTSTTQLATTAFVTTAAAAKANTSHTHTLSQITDASTKANLASPAFTGTPTAPTAASTVNNTQIATTAFVQTVAATKAAASHTHTTAQVTGLDTALAAKAPLASPALTGTPTAPTQAAGNNSTRIATTAFVTAAVAAKANTSHTHALSQITDASTKANLASPAFTGTPTAPTAASTVNNTQIATTAFVQSLLSSGNLQFKVMRFSSLSSTYVSVGVTPKLIVAIFYSTFSSSEDSYTSGYIQFYHNGTTGSIQTDQCSSVRDPGVLQVSGTTVRSTGWWSTVTLLIFY